MADEIPEEVQLGVEPIPEPAPEPDFVEFTEVDQLPDKPATDVKIRLEDGSGIEFRERMVRQESLAASVAGEPVAPAGYNFRVSNALLDEDGNVARDPITGALKIVPAEVCHEINFTGQRLAGMTREAILADFRRERGVAAEKARRHFAGMDVGAELFGSRLAPQADPGAMPEA
jgi:hypothetical protein